MQKQLEEKRRKDFCSQIGSTYDRIQQLLRKTGFGPDQVKERLDAIEKDVVDFVKLKEDDVIDTVTEMTTELQSLRSKMERMEVKLNISTEEHTSLSLVADTTYFKDRIVYLESQQQEADREKTLTEDMNHMRSLALKCGLSVPRVEEDQSLRQKELFVLDWIIHFDEYWRENETVILLADNLCVAIGELADLSLSTKTNKLTAAQKKKTKKDMDEVMAEITDYSQQILAEGVELIYNKKPVLEIAKSYLDEAKKVAGKLNKTLQGTSKK